MECDEEYHLGNQENDLIREITMEEVLSAIKETEDFTGIVLRKGMISVDDNFFFERIVDICKCFGKDYKGM